MKKKIATLVAICALVLCMPFTAFAAGAFDDGGTQSTTSSSTEHNAGNMFAVMHPVSNTDIENDLYWAGQTLDANKLNVGTSGHGSILAAGQNVTIKNATVADSIRIGAQSIVLDHIQAGNNLTLAAESISLGSEMNANGLYAAAKNLDIAGTYKGGLVSGETVNFNGVVEGDLNISAERISIGKNAQVSGELVLPEGVAVDIADGASVPNITYTAAPVQDNQNNLADSLIQVLYACMAHIVLVGLFFVIIRKSLVRSANMARTQLVKMLLAGLIIFLVAPLVCLLLIFPLITIPVAVLMVLVMLIIALFSIPFAGSALGLMLLEKRMNPVLAAVIGTVVLTICAYLPILSVLTVIFCIIFTAGYLWFCYWDMHQDRRRERLVAQQAAVTGAAVPPASADGSTVPPAPTGNPVDVSAPSQGATPVPEPEQQQQPATPEQAQQPEQQSQPPAEQQQPDQSVSPEQSDQSNQPGSQR